MINDHYSQYLSTDNYRYLVNHFIGDPWAPEKSRRETVKFLRDNLSRGSVFIAGVYINPNTGKLNDGEAAHWVVITGISNFNFTQVDSENGVADFPSRENWIRIYNPFDNETEYYHWSVFSETWVKDGNFLALVNRKSLSTIPRRNSCEKPFPQ